MLRKELKTFFKNVITANIDILFSLFLIIYGIYLKLIENILIYFLKQHLKLYFLGLKININLNSILLVLLLYLHTYGRNMKWNPHIHIIITEGAVGKNNVFKKFDFISYDALRKRFQKILIDLLEKDIGKDKFKTIKNFIYKKSNNSFYVYAEKKNNPSTQNMIEYTVRYTGKPAMAESRILDYYNDYVTFWYQRHEDNQVVVEKLHIFNFISKRAKSLLIKKF